MKCLFVLFLVLFALVQNKLSAQNSECVDCSNNNVKIGYNNSINNAYQFQSILGNGNTTLRNNAVAIGSESFARHSHSYVFGSFSEANGMHSYCIGSNSIAQTTYSYAIGYSAKSMFGNAFSIGNFVKSNATGGYVFGLGISSSEPLSNSVENSLAIGMKSTKPTLFISESTASSANNLTGKIGIGSVTSPQAKLHIRADELEDASLLLEASAGGQAKVILSEWHEIAYETDENLHLRTAQSKAFVFHRGDIFIEDIQSGIIMRSPNGQCWRGRVNDQGMLAFEQTECPTAETALPEHGQEKHLMRVFPNPASKHLEVVADGLNGSYTLRLLTATGQLMLEQQSRATHTQLNIQNLPSGTYLLVLEQDGQMKDSVKVLVE
jgi:hypothetical protein